MPENKYYQNSRKVPKLQKSIKTVKKYENCGKVPTMQETTREWKNYTK